MPRFTISESLGLGSISSQNNGKDFQGRMGERSAQCRSNPLLNANFHRHLDLEFRQPLGRRGVGADRVGRVNGRHQGAAGCRQTVAIGGSGLLCAGGTKWICGAEVMDDENGAWSQTFTHTQIGQWLQSNSPTAFKSPHSLLTRIKPPPPPAHRHRTKL